MRLTAIFGIMMFLLIPVAIAEQKQCVSADQYISIITKPDFAIGENIENITIKIQSSIFDVSTTKVSALLYDGDTEVGTRLYNSFTNQLGEVKVNFQYAPKKSGTLTIKAIVRDSSGNEYKNQKSINIKKTLDTKLTCDLIGYVGRQVKCEWKTYDADNGQLIVTDSTVSVKQGISDIIYNPTSSSSFTFVSSTIGSVDVSVESRKENYIKDLDKTVVQIQGLERTQDFLIDKKDFFDYSGTGISTGTHKLVFIIEESGVPIQIQTIDATVKNPSGQEVKLSFYPGSSTGEYQSTYTFETAGQSYDLSGRIIFKEEEKEPLVFQYKIPTLQSGTEATRSTITYAIIGGSIGLVIIIGGIIFFVRRK